jgi:hypothetical protein
MSPVAPHAVFLACLFTGSVVHARGSPVPFVAEHEATIVGDEVRWNTRILVCEDPPHPYHTSSVGRVERTGDTVRLEPPFVDGAPIQVVRLADPNLVFVPSEALGAHRTRHGFELFRPDHEERAQVLRCLREQGVDLPPSALLVAKPPGKSTPPLEGRLVRRQAGANAVLGVSAALLAGAIGALVVAWRRLGRRVRLEAAEAILRADMPDL